MIQVNKFSKYLHKKQLNNSFVSLLWIINSQFWRSITSPFFSFIFPLIFVLFLGNILGYYFMFGSFMAIGSTTVGMIALPMAIFEFKSSILAKRIGATTISKKTFLGSIILYYSIIMIIATFFTLVMMVLIFSSHLYNGKEALSNISNPSGEFIPNLELQNLKTAPPFIDFLTHINWGGFIYGLILNTLVATSFGAVFGAYAKSAMVIQGISVPILIMSLFFAQQSFPISMVAESRPFWYASYITPFKASSNIIVPSFNGVFANNWTENNVISIKELANYIKSDEFGVILQNKGLSLSQAQELVKSLGTHSTFQLSGEIDTIKIMDPSKWLGDLNKFIGEEIGKFNQMNAKDTTTLVQINPPSLPDTYTLVKLKINNQIELLGGANPFSNTDYLLIDRSFSSKLFIAMTGTEKIINLFIPYVWIIAFSLIALRGFKWSIR